MRDTGSAVICNTFDYGIVSSRFKYGKYEINIYEQTDKYFRFIDEHVRPQTSSERVNGTSSEERVHRWSPPSHIFITILLLIYNINCFL